MSNIADQDVNEQETQNAPLEHEDLDKVNLLPALSLSNLSQAKHDMMKSVIANLRV